MSVFYVTGFHGENIELVLLNSCVEWIDMLSNHCQRMISCLFQAFSVYSKKSIFLKWQLLNKSTVNIFVTLVHVRATVRQVSQEELIEQDERPTRRDPARKLYATYTP